MSEGRWGSDLYCPFSVFRPASTLCCPESLFYPSMHVFKQQSSSFLLAIREMTGGSVDTLTVIYSTRITIITSNLVPFACSDCFIVFSTSLPRTVLHQRAVRHAALPGRLLRSVPKYTQPGSRCLTTNLPLCCHRYTLALAGAYESCAQERLRFTGCNLDKERKLFF